MRGEMRPNEATAETPATTFPAPPVTRTGTRRMLVEPTISS
jgi:hypothetical protein